MKTFILCIAMALTGCAHLKTHTGDMKLDSQCLDLDDEQCLESQGVRQKGTIKSWSPGETLHSADLNSNFNHIHNLMVGGHGARLVDADVNPGAAIAQSKITGLAGYVPAAWGTFAALCGTGSCSEVLTAANGVAGLQHTSVGNWTVTWGTVRTDAFYSLFITPRAINTVCNVSTMTAATALLQCYTDTTGAAVDQNFSFMMLDN